MEPDLIELKRLLEDWQLNMQEHGGWNAVFGVIMISRGSFQDLGMTETTGASLPKCWLPVSTCSEEPLMSTREKRSV